MKDRQDRRHPAHTSVEVRLSGWDEYIRLYTQEVSLGGLFIESDSPAELFSDLQVCIVLPEGAGELELAARVVHVVTAEQARAHGRRPGMGVQLGERSVVEQKKMELLLDAVQSGDSGQIATVMGPGEGQGGPNADLVRTLAERRVEIERRDPLDVFGLTRVDSVDELRGVFLRLAKDFHPHRFARHNDRDVDRGARMLFAALESAYCNAKEALGRANRKATTAAADLPAEPDADSAPRAATAAPASPAAKATRPVTRPRLNEIAEEALARAALEASGTAPGAGREDAQETAPGAAAANAPSNAQGDDPGSERGDELRDDPTAPSVVAELQLKITDGLRHLSRKMYGDAIEQLAQAAALDPLNRDAQIWLRVARARKARAGGDEAKAVMLYQSILDELDDAHHESLAAVRRRPSGSSMRAGLRRLLGKDR